MLQLSSMIYILNKINEYKIRIQFKMASFKTIFYLYLPKFCNEVQKKKKRKKMKLVSRDHQTDETLQAERLQLVDTLVLTENDFPRHYYNSYNLYESK